MGLEEKLRQELKEALRAGDSIKRDTLRLLLAAVKNAEIAKGHPLEEGDVLAVVVREARLRRESIEAFNKGNRPDLVAKEEAELKVLQSYLPQQLTREEIADLAREAIAQVGASGPKDKGKVMGQLMPQVKGKAQGQEVSQVVDQLLSQLVQG